MSFSFPLLLFLEVGDIFKATEDQTFTRLKKIQLEEFSDEHYIFPLKARRI
jgi:hypothetical protein